MSLRKHDLSHIKGKCRFQVSKLCLRVFKFPFLWRCSFPSICILFLCSVKVIFDYKRLSRGHFKLLKQISHAWSLPWQCPKFRVIFESRAHSCPYLIEFSVRENETFFDQLCKHMSQRRYKVSWVKQLRLAKHFTRLNKGIDVHNAAHQN